MKTEVYLSLGSNMGDRRGNLDKALEMLSEALGSSPEKVASYLETEPWGFDSASHFINTAALFLT